MGSRCFNKRLVSPSLFSAFFLLAVKQVNSADIDYLQVKNNLFSLRPLVRPSVESVRPNFTSPDLCRRLPPPAIFAVGRGKTELQRGARRHDFSPVA